MYIEMVRIWNINIVVLEENSLKEWWKLYKMLMLFGV